ncbi:MAG: hypothetical protein WC325_05245 [Candidatus Bathyarchaeia archaeon]|jgi:hypothetical protein
MGKQIKVLPIADESFGVRSMCTLVETADTKILLDASAAVAPTRDGYPPHPREYQALQLCREKINTAAQNADVLTISHYHFDHHTPSFTDWFSCWSSDEQAKTVYTNKLVLAKSYRSMVNASQRQRGWVFNKTGGAVAKTVEVADDKVFTFGETTIKFSDPVFHGSENSDLGWVLMTTIQAGSERVLFTSDVQGPMFTPTLQKILVEKPQLVVVGGPPTYLVGFKVKKEHIQTGLQNLQTLVENVPVTVLGHHLFRDVNWQSAYEPMVDCAQNVGNKVYTAADYAGKENNFLEYRRRQLFNVEPPSLEFNNWLSLPVQKREKIKPPI